MKIIKFNIILLFLLSQITTYSQDIIWQRKAGGAHADFLYDAIPTLDYGFLLAGASLSKPGTNGQGGTYDYMLAKYSEEGEKEWTKFIGGKGIDHLKQIIPTNDGGYLLAGISNSKKSDTKTTGNIGQFDIWLVKIDMEGNILWQKNYGGLANEHIGQIIKAKEGGFYIAGSSASNGLVSSKNSKHSSPDLILKQGDNFGGLDYWLLKLNYDGQLVWQKNYGGKYNDVLNKIIELPDGTLVLAGNSSSPVSGNKSITGKGKTDWWIIKTDKDGKQLWQKSYGDTTDDKLFAMILLKDGNILLGGNSTPIEASNKNTANIALLKINENGDKLWQTTFDNNGDDFLTDILQNKDGTLILGAYTAPKNRLQISGKGKDDFLLIKTKANGDELWRRSIGTQKKEVLKKIIGTRDGGYVLVGSSIKHTAKGDVNSDFFIVKIADKDKPIHPKLKLEAIPNPAVSFTKAVIGKEYEEGTMQLLDLNGKVILSKKLKGERIIPLNMKAYPVGVYIIRVRADKMQNSVKILKADH